MSLSFTSFVLSNMLSCKVCWNRQLNVGFGSAGVLCVSLITDLLLYLLTSIDDLVPFDPGIGYATGIGVSELPAAGCFASCAASWYLALFAMFSSWRSVMISISSLELNSSLSDATGWT